MSGDPGQSCCSPSKQPSTLKTVPRGAPAVDMDANRDAEFSRFADATGYRTSGEAAEWLSAFLGAPGLRIGGGTDEVQKNIVGERVLGLPGEPRPDRDLPFATGG